MFQWSRTQGWLISYAFKLVTSDQNKIHKYMEMDHSAPYSDSSKFKWIKSYTDGIHNNNRRRFVE